MPRTKTLADYQRDLASARADLADWPRREQELLQRIHAAQNEMLTAQQEVSRAQMEINSHIAGLKFRLQEARGVLNDRKHVLQQLDDSMDTLRTRNRQLPRKIRMLEQRCAEFEAAHASEPPHYEVQRAPSAPRASTPDAPENETARRTNPRVSGV